MDVVVNGAPAALVVSQEVSDKKPSRPSTPDEPPVLSKCGETAEGSKGRQADPSPSPPALSRETYVTRQRHPDKKKSPIVYRFCLQRNDRSSRDRRNGASAGFGKLALRLLKRKKQKQRRQLLRERIALLGPVLSTEGIITTEGRTLRSRTAASAASTPTPSCDNSDVEVTPVTTRTLRPRKSDVTTPAPSVEAAKAPVEAAKPAEHAKPPKSSPVNVPKEVPAKDKVSPDEVDLVDGIEILAFSSLDDLQKFTEAEEELKGPLHHPDEDVDVEYFSDLEEDPADAASAALASGALHPFLSRSSSRMSLFDSSDGEADGEVDGSTRNDDWNMKDLAVDEASCSSSKNAPSGRRSRSQEKPEMPKVGQVVDLGWGRPLRPESARNVHCLMDKSGTISRKIAEFSAAVVFQRGKPEPKTRMVMPVVCPKMLEIMKYKWATGDRGEQVTLSTAKTKAYVPPKPGTSASGGSQLKKVTLDPSTSQNKRRSDMVNKGGRPRKKPRRSRTPIAAKVPDDDDQSDSDVEIIEVRKTDEVKKKNEVMKKDEIKKKDEIEIVEIKKDEVKKDEVKKDDVKKDEVKKDEVKKKDEVEKDEDALKAIASASEAKVITTEETPPPEVEAIVREMLDFVTLRDIIQPIPFDPDQCEGLGGLDEEKSAPPAKVPAQKKMMRSGLLCELRRLDVTVFDMDEEGAEELPDLESVTSEEDCKKDMCRLGCVCESVAGRRATMPLHCGRVDCMFECSCTSTSYERKPGGRHLLDVSDATLAWIQDESERNLAKVERQFKQTVVRAKDDLIVMGSKRSRREIKMPKRFQENFITTNESFILFNLDKGKKKSLTTLTPPLTPTNKTLSPTKLITPPKVPAAKPTPPPQPKFDEEPPPPRHSYKRTLSGSSESETESEEESTSLPLRNCSVLLYRVGEEPPPHRNVAMKSTGKVRHLHNVIQSSARTSGKFTEHHRVAKRNEDKFTSLWNQHSQEKEVVCHIVKEHSISAEEWEKSGELAAPNDSTSPLKKNANSVQLIPWSYLRDKFVTGEYQIWYKRQQGNNKQKLYLTDGPTKPNKFCINLRELEEPSAENLPPMIAKLLTNESQEDDKDARCFLKSLGEYWMIAGYMQRTASGSSKPNPEVNKKVVRPMTNDEAVDIGERRPSSKAKTHPVKAQARWWLLHLTQTFDLLVFRDLGVSVRYAQIKKTAALANKDETGTFIRMCLQKKTKSKFGVYGVPGMLDCVLIGPYGLEQQPGFLAYASMSTKTSAKRYVRVPIYCANKDSEYELESRRAASPDRLLQVPHRVIGTWLYDFKSLELPRPAGAPDKHKGRRKSAGGYFSPELKSLLEDTSRTQPPSQPQAQPKLPVPTSAATHPNRAKIRAGQSLLKGSEEVKTINKNTLSVKIDGKAKEALVRVSGEVGSAPKDDTKRGFLKIRQDLMRAPTPPPATTPPPPGTPPPSDTAPSRRNSAGNVVDLEDDIEAADPSSDKEPKRDFIVSNVKNLGYIPVTYVSHTAVYIPHFSVPGQVHFFKTHDEVVKFVYTAVRQKISFIGVRPETISWRQIDSLDDASEEKQFNPGVLVGNHVITKAGLINLVKLTEEEIPSLNLPPKESDDLRTKLDLIKSLPLLRQLGRLLVGPKAGPMPQNAIVFMGVSEIQKMAAQSTLLKNHRKVLLEKQSRLEEKLKELMKDVPEEHRQKAQKEIDEILKEKPVIVLDEEPEGEKNSASICQKEFSVQEMVNVSSDEEVGTGTNPKPAFKPPTDLPPAEKSMTDKPAADKPAADKPAAAKSTADKPVTDKPEAAKPAAAKPAAAKPAAAKPAAAKPVAAKPAAAKPAAAKPAAAKPAAAKPVAAKPAAAKPAAAQPAAAQPAAAKSTAAKSVIEKPAADKSTTEEAATDKLSTSTPPTAKPTTSKSAAVDPPADKPSADNPSAAQPAVSKAPSSTAVTETIPTPSTSSATSSASAPYRPTQSLICKFPFSPLKRVNVTVKEDGIVAASTNNQLIKINQPVRTLTRSADGSIIQAIKLVDPSKLSQPPRLIANPPRILPRSAIKPNIFVPAGVPAGVPVSVAAPAPATVTQRRFPILRAMPRPKAPGSAPASAAGSAATANAATANAAARPQTVLVNRSGTPVPMTVLRPATGEPVLRLMSPNSDKVFIASPLPVVKSADMRAAGLKVLHPNIPPNQRKGSPPKTNVIRILKQVSSTATQESCVKVPVMLTPKNAPAPTSTSTSASAPTPTTSSASVAEIDTTELLID